MKTTSPRAALALGSLVLGASLLAGCRATRPGMDHWNIQSVPPRAAKHFLGYRADLDGDYRGFHVREKQHINLTLRRHFLNNNPENPFQAEDAGYSVGRPPHSILPDPLLYFHIEALAVGIVTLAWTGAFLPIPITAVIASFQDGGGHEFVEGLKEPFRTASYGGTLHLEPAPPDEFRVRRR